MWQHHLLITSSFCFISFFHMTSMWADETAALDKTPVPVDAKDAYRPTGRPDRIMLTWTDAPDTTQAVTWRTSTDAGKPRGEIAMASGNPEFVNSTTSVSATSQTLVTNLSTAVYHTVEFSGLKPGTRYAYRVGDGVNDSEWFHFSTADSQSHPFRFIYFGDAQNNVRSMWSRVIREASRDAPRAAFLLHAGDLVNRAESDEEWGEWCAAGKWLNAMIPSVPVPGNHEQAKRPGGPRQLSHHWRPQFALPLNGPRGLEETCYTMIYQGVRIVAMDSNRMHAEQAVWLDQLLSENSCKWVICTFHHPIFSTGRNRDNAELRRIWKPVLDKHHVDLVLQGHDHTYGRTGLETPVENVPEGTQLTDVQTGTVYVVSVSGPKMYSLQPRAFMKRTAEKTQLYQIISVDGEQLHYEARTAAGELYDAFTLIKQPGNINRLIEQQQRRP